MMTLTFKDVGQGDSIILEWVDQGKEKLIIIDCKKYNDSNPVLEYVKENENKILELLLLSHPHVDHCSGFSELIQYCIDSKKKINYFLHTSNNMPGFWKMAVTSKDAESKILELFSVIRKASIAIGMKHHPVQGEAVTSEISLGTNYKLKILGPTSNELDTYSKNFNMFPDDEEEGNNPNANWIATFLKIYAKDWYILLTSDISKTLLLYYGLDHPEEFTGKLILGQSPHHGSFHNHNNSFWKKRIHSSKTPIIISVGKNKFKHPHPDVVDFFNKNDYEIYSTNPIGPLVTLQSIENSIHLDTFSPILPSKLRTKYNGDKIFKIDLSGTVTVN